MKRMLCILMVLVLVFSLSAQAFADDFLYCRICGRKIPADSHVCPYCGEAVVLLDQDEVFGTPTEASEAIAVPDTATVPASAAAPVGAAGALPQVVGQQPSPATQNGPVSTVAEVPGPFHSQGVPLTSTGVRITKSPTSESVPYGGSCMFIAHAVNAASVTWYIASADTSVILEASEAQAYVSGLYVSGYNTDTLYLSGIPSWMNGCQVQACFTGEGGPVYSEIARIWTYEEEQVCTDNTPWWWYWYWYLDPYWADPVPPPPPRPLSDYPAPPDVDAAVTLPTGASVAPELPGTAADYPSAVVVHVDHHVDPEIP